MKTKMQTGANRHPFRRVVTVLAALALPFALAGCGGGDNGGNTGTSNEDKPLPTDCSVGIAFDAGTADENLAYLGEICFQETGFTKDTAGYEFTDGESSGAVTLVVKQSSSGRSITAKADNQVDFEDGLTVSKVAYN